MVSVAGWKGTIWKSSDRKGNQMYVSHHNLVAASLIEVHHGVEQIVVDLNS
jgi:hypothetical protein